MDRFTPYKIGVPVRLAKQVSHVHSSVITSWNKKY